jgi:hypothetical protein
MKPLIRTAFALFSLAAALVATPASAAVVSINGPASVAPGAPLQLDVTASGFSDLYAFQFDVTFDPALFQAVGVTEGGFLSAAGTTFFDGGTIDNGGGMVTFVFGTLIGPGAGASGSGLLAHIDFDTVGGFLSTGSFQISNLVALDSSLNPIDADVRGLRVSIPEPSALALTLVALIAGAGVPRHLARRARRNQPETA